MLTLFTFGGLLLAAVTAFAALALLGLALKLVFKLLLLPLTVVAWAVKTVLAVAFGLVALVVAPLLLAGLVAVVVPLLLLAVPFVVIGGLVGLGAWALAS